MRSQSPPRSKSSKPVVRYVAFLRGINLGNRRVKNTQLVEAFQSLPISNVDTFLASGNVIFDSVPMDESEFRTKAETALDQKLSMTVEVFLRSMDDLAKIANSNPFALNSTEQENFTVNVLFLGDPVSSSLKKATTAWRSDYDDFAFGRREIYWLCRGPKMSDSILFSNNTMAKQMTVSSTMRNMRTVVRLTRQFNQA